MKILAHAKGGPCSRVCACKNPDFTPVCRMQKLDNPQKNLLEFIPKCIIVRVEGGSPEFFLGVQSYSFGNSGPHAKIQNPPKIFPRVHPQIYHSGG